MRPDRKRLPRPSASASRKSLSAWTNSMRPIPCSVTRGCRLTITYPEILDMQVTAIISAACNMTKKGVSVLPEIMIPLVIDARELKILELRTREVADAIIAKSGLKLSYMVGTMIEVPRAALLADQIAQVAEFFSFGTNDLTQMTLGMSRDDAGKFLPDYVDEKKTGIFKADPFQSLDQAGVGLLVKMGIEKGRSHQGETQGRHLRRTRRRSSVRQVLPQSRDELRILFPLPRPPSPDWPRLRS